MKASALMLTISLLLTGSGLVFAESNPLPELNDPLSGVISPEKEQVIGNILLRQARAQLPVIGDPLSQEYLQALSYTLAEHSELKVKSLSTLLIRNPDINAFAMPGGVIGANTGLFAYAENEDELAAVLAHEIAHLSQRHFARMIDRQKNQQVATLGAYLASVLLLFTAGIEQGMGAMAATQALDQQNALSFSRNNEKEADRIGMQTLAQAGINPQAMTSFFTKLYKSNQFAGNRPPEYLLSHPVTESRIADARSRSEKYPESRSSDSLDFQLIKYRLAVIETNQLEKLTKQLEVKAEQSRGEQQVGVQYGLVICYTELKRFKEARKLLEKLSADKPMRIAYLLAKAEIEFEADNFAASKKILESGLSLHPGNYPLSVLYAETLLKNRQLGEATYLLQSLSISNNEDPYIWRRLAEAYGLSGHQLGVYIAKAEYFYLYGMNQKAVEQLQLALPLTKGNFQMQSKVEARIEAIENENKQLKL